jgi:PadR family transcriptional regulator, regulatory protein PadR
VVALPASSAPHRFAVSCFPGFVIAHRCVLCPLWITIIGCSQLTPILGAYMALQYMASPVPDRELKKGSAELMILALLEDRARHGYEIGQLIELRSRGAIRFNVASLYPLLYRLEKRNWIRGRWIEKAGQRRRRYYRLTASGKNVLSKQRAGWREFVEAISLITGIQHA